MNMTVFGDVIPCSLLEFTDVSEVFTASFIRAISEPCVERWVKM